MRRMITNKQIEGLENLNQRITVNEDDTTIVATPIQFGTDPELANMEIYSSNPNRVDVEYNKEVVMRYNGNGDETSLSFENGDSGVTVLSLTFENLILMNLPTSNPHIARALWNDNGTLKISSGY